MKPQLPKLPDELVEEARVVFERVDFDQWEVGDFLCSIVEELGEVWKQSGVRNARAEIIRQLASATGWDCSTLRDRESLARFYPPNVREVYIPPLCYSQLRACKAAGARWMEYADWACNNLPAPVDAIRSRIKHNGHDVAIWITRWERLQHLAELLVNDSAVPEKIRTILEGVLRNTEE